MGRWTDGDARRRAQEAEHVRARLMGYIDMAYDYAIPWRRHGDGSGSVMGKLTDSTGPSAVQNFAGNLQLAAWPSESRPIALRAGPLVQHMGDPNVVAEMDRELELASDMVTVLMRAGNFELALQEAFCDLSIGTGAMLLNPGRNGRRVLTAKSVPAWQLAFDEGADGLLQNTYWRRNEQWWKLRELFPKASWSDAQRQKIDGGSTDTVEVLQATYLDEDADLYRTVAIVGQSVVWEREDRASPWVAPRYWKIPGMPWGIGPLLLALGDIRTLNKSVELVLLAAELAIAPPMLISDDGIVNPESVEVGPYGLIRTSRMGGVGGDPIKPLNLNSRVDIGLRMQEGMEARIRKVLLDNPLPSPGGAVRSPTEIIERARHSQRETAGAFGRIFREGIEPAVVRALDLADRANLPGCEWDRVRPDNLLRRVQMLGPLARDVQREDALAFAQFTEMLVALGGPEIRDSILKMQDALPEVADLMGVPSRWTLTPREREEKAQADAAAAMQAMEMQMQMQAMQQVPPGQPGQPGAPAMPANDPGALPGGDMLGALR